MLIRTSVARAGVAALAWTFALPPNWTLAGTLRDAGGQPIPEAEVVLLQGGVAVRRDRSDPAGHFSLGVLESDTATVSVHRLGFQPRILRVHSPVANGDALSIVLEQSASTIDTLRVLGARPEEGDRALAEFRARARGSHAGHFFDETQIDEMHLQFTSDAMRRVPGVVVRPSGGIGNTVRIRGCAPLVWVDGQRVKGAELDDITHGSDVAALEVYSSLSGVPAAYTDRSATCGTILVWLRAR